MEYFDAKASDWDNNPSHVDRAKAVAEAIKKSVPLSPNMTGFEYGAGTGLLSFNLLGSLKEITLADNSKGMLEVIKEKIKSRYVNNMKAMYLDLEKDEIPEEKFDIIYTLMTLHHINAPEPVINKFYRMLNTHGFLCLVDLYKEDGSFHGQDFQGHRGFDAESLKALLAKSGLHEVRYAECYKMKRMVEGTERVFSLFLMTGQKK